jgi:Kef-type K+ transport system membrane component KefB
MSNNNIVSSSPIILVFGSIIYGINHLLAKRRDSLDMLVYIIGGIILSTCSSHKQLWFTPVEMLGDVGVIALMFLAGTMVRPDVFHKERDTTLQIAVSGMIVPLVLTFVTMRFVLGFSIKTSLVTSIALSITAEATSAKVLLDRGKINTSYGSTILASGIIDDIVGVGAFIIIMALHVNVSISSIILIVTIVAAFFAGCMLKSKVTSDKIAQHPLFIISVGFFFLSLGHNIKFKNVFTTYLPFVLLVVAIIGKVGGVMLNYGSVPFNANELGIIAWGMNSRGVIGLGIVLIALRHGLITPAIFTSILFVALVTIFIFPPILDSYIKQIDKSTHGLHT